MNAARVGRDASTSVPAPSAAMTTTTAAEPVVETTCDRRFFHVPHDTTDGPCSGFVEPDHLTKDELAEQIARLRRECTAYGYDAGYADAESGRARSNAWRGDES